MLKKIIEDRIYSLLTIIIVVIIIASLSFPETFPTFENFRQLFLNLSIDTIVAVGMMILLISGSFDLSVGSVVAWAGCLTAYLMHVFTVPVPVAISIGVLACLAIGYVNGYLIAYQGINPMIQTLAMIGIIRGLALMTSCSGIQKLPYWFGDIGHSRQL